MNKFSRRQFLERGLALAPVALLPSWSVHAADATTESTTFFVTADPQINIPKWGTAGTEQIIDVMNDLPGKEFPLGGKVGKPVGVIVAGDLVDDLGNAENWTRYKSFFDPRGKAKLQFPAYELIGNHDLSSRQPAGELNHLQKEFIERNKLRQGSFDFDEHHYHYAWTWAGVRFIQLNLFPGNIHRPVYDRVAPWNDPRRSLDFLKDELGKRVSDRNQPIVLVWHYGLRGWGLEKWWTKEDLTALAKVIKGYNIALILHGHEHRFDQYQWEGYDVIMAPSPQQDRDPRQPELASKPKGFLVFRIHADKLEMAHHTGSEWKQTWSKALQAK